MAYNFRKHSSIPVKNRIKSNIMRRALKSQLINYNEDSIIYNPYKCGKSEINRNLCPCCRFIGKQSINKII